MSRASGDPHRTGARIRVLMIDPGGERGGAERVAETLARNSGTRFDVAIACLSPGPWPEELADAGIESHVLERKRLRRVDRVLGIVVRLARLIRSERIRIVHANGNTALPYASLAAKLTRSRLLWHLHDPQSNSGLRRRTLLRLLRLIRPDYIVFSNDTGAASWLPLLTPAPPHSVVVPGVDTDQLAMGVGARARDRFDIAPDAPMVLMLARLVAYKGHEDLIQAAPLLRHSVPGVRIVLCATAAQDADMRRLRELSHELELDDIVVLAGGVSERVRADLLAATTVLAHPARVEPLGLAMLEAMTLGKPVVAAASAGARFLLRDGHDGGVLVPPADPRALADALSELLLDPARRAELGRAGEERAADFSNEQMVRRIEAVWSSLMRADEP